MHVHLIGVCGTGMGALAGLLKAAGHRVTGSDSAFAPPMGPALKRYGVETMLGPNSDNLSPAPDLVVVGNVCRSTNEEARAAIDGGLAYRSFPALMEELFLGERRSFVMAGTHGKTTTTSLMAFLLREVGQDPGFLVGGLPLDFDASFRLGSKSSPFVIEGDEYDSAFFEKSPKFWRYNPHAVLLTSAEHDHIDIYPDRESYEAAFHGLIDRIPEDGLLVAYAGDEAVRRIATRAKCRVSFYALDGDDCGDVSPIWMGALAPASGGVTPIDLYGGGTMMGRVHFPMSGQHNARNLLGVLALAAEGAGADMASLMKACTRFSGVRRRQDLLALAGGIHIYDDFAHHPTAVFETLRGLRSKHPTGRLIVAFEPRSATASRRLHQELYAQAFSHADLALLAPVGRKEIAIAERLDTAQIAREINERGGQALAPESLDEVLAVIGREAKAGDTVVLMSNGTFGGLYDDVIAALTPVRNEETP
ncbi:MAG: UDP-N-acetylmuramate: L-alanyl-gamma-D-glutamyl-meso-diaminopimelate ligase [Polyangiales bacterium]|jgi:UDP-N-acetylmuramate: L-alanyl-gamma-D-glutamyl-meso-diaminopimelate ligase